ATSHDLELQRERSALAHMQALHRAHLDRARAAATRLADEAAEATEDGIRDLVDEDGEVDAAIRAALVRQSADRAMHAIRRSNELEAMGEALAFGYTQSADDSRLDVGRLTVIDDSTGEPVLVDWRAPAAVPFYRATPIDRLGVERRRHFVYAGDELVGYSDELFDIDDLVDGVEAHGGLRGEAAILAALDLPTRDQMRSVVATIQAEQDAVVRAPSNGALVVQGGPGTGKTVVALHRAAYLLYEHRAALSDTGVLIVGPSSEFLAYISGVLPSLGESGVISVTASELFAGILRGREEPDHVAAIKGGEIMVELLAHAVADRQRRPGEALSTYYGSRRVVLDLATLEGIFDRAQRHATHNDGAAAFRRGVIDALALTVHDPTFASMSDAVDSFRSSGRVRHFIMRHWPTLTPEQALNDLLGSKALLHSASRGLPLAVRERSALYRDRVSEADLDRVRWSDADVPLLDELYELLGPVMPEAHDEQLRRDALDEFELAQRDEEEADEDDESVFDREALDPEGVGFEVLSLEDPYLDTRAADG
ncbi:MAG: hypothetical protein R2710_20805, partial [Acidimicrobiales bacterium]